MRRIALFCAAVTFATISLSAEREDYYCSVPYIISPGGESIVYFGKGDSRVEYKLRGVTVTYEEMAYIDAVQEYATAYQTLLSCLEGNNNLTTTIRTQVAANWATAVEQSIRLAGAEQRKLDAAYAEQLYLDMQSAGSDAATAKKEYDETRAHLEGVAESCRKLFNETSADISAQLKLMAGTAAAIAEAAKADLADVVKKVKDLSEKSDRTEDEISELRTLKAKMSEYVTITRAGEIAAQKAEEAIQKLGMKSVIDVSQFELSAISSNNWNSLSRFLGRKTGKTGDDTKDETGGIFGTPWQLLKANKGYVYGASDTIITMLDDAGYAPILSADELSKWAELANRDRPARYFLYSDDGNGRPMLTAETLHGGDDRVSFPAPSNWVDGQTIVWSNGVYTAVGSAGGGRMADTELASKSPSEMTKTIDVTRDKVTTNEYFAVHGFADAKVGDIAYKKSATELGWKVEQGAGYRFIGTDNSEYTIPGAGATNIVRFSSATNANVTVTIESTKGIPNDVTIRIGVYYL